MNYLLLFLTVLIAFTRGMIFVFYLIFVRVSLRISHILSKILGKYRRMDKVFGTLGKIPDQVYQEIKAEEDNEDY